MSWLSMKNKHRIKDIYVKQDDGLYRAKDCYVCQESALYKWARAGIAKLLDGYSFKDTVVEGIEGGFLLYVEVANSAPESYLEELVLSSADSAAPIYGYTNDFDFGKKLSIVKPSGMDIYLNEDSGDGMFEQVFNVTNYDYNFSFLASFKADATKNLSGFMSSNYIKDLTPFGWWDVSNLENAESMFEGCRVLTDTSAISGWHTMNLKTAKSMFSNCSLLTDVSGPEGFDTTALEDIDYMFRYCSSLTEIDMSGWDLSNLRTATNVFNDTAIAKIKTPSVLPGCPFWVPGTWAKEGSSEQITSLNIAAAEPNTVYTKVST